MPKAILLEDEFGFYYACPACYNIVGDLDEKEGWIFPYRCSFCGEDIEEPGEEIV